MHEELGYQSPPTDSPGGVDLIHDVRIQSDEETKANSSYTSTTQDRNMVGSTQPWLESTIELDMFNAFDFNDLNFSNPVLATPPNHFQRQSVNSDFVDNELDQLLQLVDDDPNFNIDSFVTV